MNKKPRAVSRDQRREQLIRSELKKRRKMLQENVGKADDAIPSKEIIHAIREAGLWPRLTEGRVAEAVIAFTNRMVYEEIYKAYLDMFY